MMYHTNKNIVNFHWSYHSTHHQDFPQNSKLLQMYHHYYFLAIPMACGSSQARDQTHTPQWPKPLQGQCQLLNLLHHKRTPHHCLLKSTWQSKIRERLFYIQPCGNSASRNWHKMCTIHLLSLTAAHMPVHLLSTVSEKRAREKKNAEPKHDPRSLTWHWSQYIQPCSPPLGPWDTTVSPPSLHLSLTWLGPSAFVRHWPSLNQSHHLLTLEDSSFSGLKAGSHFSLSLYFSSLTWL